MSKMCVIEELTTQHVVFVHYFLELCILPFSILDGVDPALRYGNQNVQYV